jgi:endonuclease YncB( thermonuclease family)
MRGAHFARRCAVLWPVLAVLLLATTISAGAAGEIEGTPDVLDGDTLVLEGHRLRLAGVDAPEPGQRCWLKDRLYDCGNVARTALLDLTAGATVVCRPRGPGPDETTLALCTAGGYDLSEGMAYTGWALALPGTEGRYRHEEERAQTAGHGLWRGDFVAPWDWRAGARLPQETE